VIAEKPIIIGAKPPANNSPSPPMSEPHAPPALRPARLVIDTNAMLSWLIFRDPWAAALEATLQRGAACWLASPATLGELTHVLTRPLPARWEAARKHALTLPWNLAAQHCADPPAAHHPGFACRDAADQKFIDLALAEQAHWLITRDRDLLQLRRRAASVGLTIGTPAHWMAQAAG